MRVEVGKKRTTGRARRPLLLLAAILLLVLLSIVGNAAAAPSTDDVDQPHTADPSDGFVSSSSDVEDYEEDEDERAAPKKEWTPPLATQNTDGSGSRQQLNWKNIDPWDFQYEALAVVGLIVYLALHYYGRSINLAVAKGWLQATLPVWDANFAHVGDEKKYTLIRDGPADFLFYASGRLHIQKVVGYIKLLPRFDIVSYLANAVTPDTAPEYDRVVLEMTLDPALQGLVFALLPKRTSNKIVKKRFDLQDFTNPRSHAKFPKDHYVLLTDCPEFANVLFEDESFLNTLWASVGLNVKGEGKQLRFPAIESIILSDQHKVLPNTIEELYTAPKMLTATFVIPQKATEFDVQLMMQLVRTLMDIVDYNAQMHFSAETRSKLKKIRQGAEEKVSKKLEEAKKAELAKQKQEALRKKEQEISKMSPEEQRKWEEKKQKAEMKKRMKRSKIIM
ncbi:hypothetical protein HDU96_004939 [Phlyctochytrium bullatum]|nr:hypothetical protein HDU96_004939 [Phlyctochytrium bullatum]